jgi:deoxyribodipyrimidine photo-lyase
MNKYTLFIFRRDLRLIDNNGLNYAMESVKNILPIFIFTPEQISTKNKYKTNNGIQFMIESLKELDSNLRKYKSRLHLFYGDNIKILKKISKKININNIIFNMDYTPYAIKRDKEIKDFCDSKNINCISTEDYLLKNIGTFNKKDGDPYTIFTPFKNNGLKHKIKKPVKSQSKNLTTTNKLDESGYIEYVINNDILVNGGRENGLKKLNLIKKQKKYNENRNKLDIKTTHLSAFIKFGCISIREVYWEIKNILGIQNALLSQIFWREFYFYIAYYFPRVLKGKNFNKKYNGIKWVWNKHHFDKWCNGTTGYPVIDAGMRELNKTGFMHNRARLLTSNFMNRLLGMDWRHGEMYYATQLTDYDPAVNNGNWGWISSTGVDTKPYFQRLFNPWLQSKKFDADAEYIKKWIPSLKHIPAKELHNWDDYYHNYDLNQIHYVKPIVNYKQSRERSKKQYQEVL